MTDAGQVRVSSLVFVEETYRQRTNPELSNFGSSRLPLEHGSPPPKKERNGTVSDRRIVSQSQSQLIVGGMLIRRSPLGGLGLVHLESTRTDWVS